MDQSTESIEIIYSIPMSMLELCHFVCIWIKILINYSCHTDGFLLENFQGLEDLVFIKFSLSRFLRINFPDFTKIFYYGLPLVGVLLLQQFLGVCQITDLHHPVIFVLISGIWLLEFVFTLFYRAKTT